MIDITSSLPSSVNYSSLSVIGASGAAYADDHHNMQLRFSPQGAQALPTRQAGGAVALMQAFLDGVRVGRDFTDDWREVALVARDVDRVRASMEQQVVMGGEHV